MTLLTSNQPPPPFDFGPLTSFFNSLVDTQHFFEKRLATIEEKVSQLESISRPILLDHKKKNLTESKVAEKLAHGLQPDDLPEQAQNQQDTIHDQQQASQIPKICAPILPHEHVQFPQQIDDAPKRKPKSKLWYELHSIPFEDTDQALPVMSLTCNLNINNNPIQIPYDTNFNGTADRPSNNKVQSLSPHKRIHPPNPLLDNKYDTTIQLYDDSSLLSKSDVTAVKKHARDSQSLGREAPSLHVGATDLSCLAHELSDMPRLMDFFQTNQNQSRGDICDLRKSVQPRPDNVQLCLSPSNHVKQRNFQQSSPSKDRQPTIVIDDYDDFMLDTNHPKNISTLNNIQPLSHPSENKCHEKNNSSCASEIPQLTLQRNFNHDLQVKKFSTSNPGQSKSSITPKSNVHLEQRPHRKDMEPKSSISKGNKKNKKPLFQVTLAEINTSCPKKTKMKNKNPIIPELPSNSSSPELLERDGWKTNTRTRKKLSFDSSPILSRKIGNICTTKVDDIAQPQPQQQTGKIRAEKRPTRDGFACNPVVRGAEARQALKGTSCKDCEQLYRTVANGDQEKYSRLVNGCSRHRFQYTPEATPETWLKNTFFPDTETQPPPGYFKSQEAGPTDK